MRPCGTAAGHGLTVQSAQPNGCAVVLSHSECCPAAVLLLSTSPGAEGVESNRLSSIALLVAASLAICGPALLARNVSPSATFFNQAIALIGWGLLLALASASMPRSGAWELRRVAPGVLALGVMALGTAFANVFERLPGSLALSALALLASAALTTLVAARASREEALRLFHAVCAALLVAGLLSVPLAIVQTFAPDLADGEWIAKAGAQGRAGGNLRQPNHLSSLLLWSLVALVWTHDRLVEKDTAAAVKLYRILSAVGLAALTLGVALTASRTGTVCIVLLAVWAASDKNLSPFSRRMLWAAPLIYWLCWFGLSEWGHAAGHAFAGDTQLHKSDLSSSRFGIWSNTFSLMRDSPWLGVGWGEFNFAWSLTPFPGRPGAFFDHTHNLPLNLLVELGIPLGMLVILLLLWALVKAFMACLDAAVSQSAMVRAAFVMALMMVVHSMLEYPLWYAYFLLPTTFALGICLGGSAQGADVKGEADASIRKSSLWPRRVLVAASLALVAGTVASVVDYMRVVAIFSASEDDMPLSYRIAEGQKSWFFAHHADYAAATVAEHPSEAMKAFRRAPHFLLDTRLMMAWAKAYNERGDVERARYIADRLREFRNSDAAEFFAECDKPLKAGGAKPFQCTPATRHFTYEDFKMRSN